MHTNALCRASACAPRRSASSVFHRCLALLALVCVLGAPAPVSAQAQCAPRTFSVAETEVLKAYVAYYGRPADTGGLAFWARGFASGGGLNAIIESFGNSREFTERYGGLNAEALINNLFMQAFGRLADAGGLAFYRDAFNSGRRSLQRIALDVLNGARNQDLQVIVNKLLVSRHVLTRLEQAGRTYVEGLNTLLAPVGVDELSARNACGVADALIGVPAPGANRIAGVVVPRAGNRADSDTRDPFAPRVFNGSIASAQVVPAVATVGGHVSIQDDLDDYFRVSLRAGQNILLNFPLAEGADIDLYLYRTSGELVDASLGTSSFESLVVPQDGTYLVNVYAYSGAANYTLNIGLGALPAEAELGALRLSAPIVVGEAVVRLREEVAGAAPLMAEAMAENALAAAGAVRAAGAPDREMRWKLRLPAAAPTTLTPRSGLEAAADERDKRLDTLLAIKALRADPLLELVEPVFRVKPLQLRPNDSLYPRQWHYPQISLPQAWAYTTGDPDVIVAVVDTGVLMAHPDLAGQFVSGYDFVSAPSRSADGNGIDPDPTDPGDSDGIGRNSWHGTHVAGTIAAQSNNGIGGAGVAGSSRIMPVRVLGVGGGTNYDVMQGVRFAAGLPNDSGRVPAQPARIINLSLGGPSASFADQQVFRAVRERGVIVIAAAGNESSTAPSYPAAYDGVVSVSSVGPDAALAYYSNTGATVDVAAPGGDMSRDTNADGSPDGVLSTYASPDGRDYRYELQQGTSMAAPHVAGVAALMVSLHEALDPAGFDAALAGGALSDDIGAAGRDNAYGHGLINAWKAVSEAQRLAGGGGGNLPPLPVVAPAMLNLGTQLDSGVVVLENRGGGSLGVTAIDTTAGWLRVTAVAPDPGAVGQYRIQADRSRLAAGLHQGRVQFSTTAGAVGVAVTVEKVPSSAGADDSGHQYVLLIDAETNLAVDSHWGQVGAGGLAFSFDALAPGRYRILAGSNMNDDGYICDAGEACGAYPDLAGWGVIEVPSAEATAIRFSSGFGVELTNAGVAGVSGARPGGP